MEYSKLNDKNDGINIINNKLKQFSIFIPVNIKIFNEKVDFKCLNDINNDELKRKYELNKNNFIFSFKELKFLKNIEKNENYLLFDNLTLNGVKLINYYNNLIENTKDNFEETKIIKKEFSSILYKFIINISINDAELESKIETFEKIGFFYILPYEQIGDNEDDLYSIKLGFNYTPNITEIL